VIASEIVHKHIDGMAYLLANELEKKPRGQQMGPSSKSHCKRPYQKLKRHKRALGKHPLQKKTSTIPKPIDNKVCRT
jgi:hypothetical protein